MKSKPKVNVFQLLIIIYSFLLTFCFLNEIACLGYYTYVFDKEARELMPGKQIFPEFDTNGDVKNMDEVTAWEYMSFVPEKLYKVHNYFSRVAYSGAAVQSLVLLGLFLPMLICYRRTNEKLTFPIVFLTLILVIAWVVLPWVCGDDFKLSVF